MAVQNRYSRPSTLDPTTPHASTNQPPSRFLPPHILTSRIAEKQAEYENLSQLRDLSASLAAQMESLEAKLNCLADGTESTKCHLEKSNIGVADVLANWQNVFRAINLATGINLRFPGQDIVKLGSLARPEEERGLPEMLVRIPVNDPKSEETDKQ
jgi:DASH complex subunit DAD2